MSRVPPPRVLILAVAIASAFVALPAASVNRPARTAIQPHKAKPLKALRTTSARTQAQSAAPGPISPYARAAAQRDAAGLAPPGHARVLQRTPPVPVPPTAE
jgi:hypothetical protein